MALSFYSPAMTPPDEGARQQAVDASGVVGAPPDPELYAIVGLASRSFDVPMAAISIIDRDRQWLAARIGMPLPELSRNISFCAHAILHPDEILVVSDALTDERFAGNPLVTEPPSMRFYAGVSLLGDGEQPLGTLCISDHRPRGLDPAGRTLLAALARRAEQAFAALRPGAGTP